MGGNTDFLDTRTAFEELSGDFKRELLENDYVSFSTCFFYFSLSLLPIFESNERANGRMNEQPSDPMNQP